MTETKGKGQRLSKRPHPSSLGKESSMDDRKNRNNQRQSTNKRSSNDKQHVSDNDNSTDSQSSSSDDDDNDKDKDQQHPSLDEVNLGSIMSKILKVPVAKDETPILAKRQAVERKIEEEKIDKQAKSLLRREAKTARDAAHQLPVLNNKEKLLKKAATKGVVQLFNAVQQHQAAKEKAAKEAKEQKQSKSSSALLPSPPKEEKDVKAVSKASFLELLKMGGASKSSK